MFPIILHTIQQFSRNKLLGARILSGSLGMIFLATLSQLALSEQSKVFTDFALSLIELRTLMIILYTGSTLIDTQIKNKTFALLYMRVGSKSKIMLAQCIGFGIIILCVMGILSALYLSIMLLEGRTVHTIIFYALRASFLKMLITFAIVFALSTASQPFIAFLGGMVIYVAAHRAGLIKVFATLSEQFSSFQRIIFDILYLVLPNFTLLSPKDHLINPALIATPLQILRVSIYACIRISILLIIASRSFSQRKQL